jgi:hypothetical protein
MTFKRVEPRQAVEWIRGAVRLILANPAPFLLMGMAMNLIALVPVLGPIVRMVVTPVLYAGIASAARTQNEGGQADFMQLLDGFRVPGRAGPLITLCLPGVALQIISASVLLGIVAKAQSASGSAAPDPSQLDPATLLEMAQMMMLALVTLTPLALFVAALLFFAITRVMFDGITALSALRESLRAVFASAGAFLLAVLTLFFASVAITLPLLAIHPMLALLVINTLLPPLIACVLYLAWRDVFARPAQSESEGAEPSPAVIEV